MASWAAAMFPAQTRPRPRGTRTGTPVCKWAFTPSSWQNLLAIKRVLTIQSFSHQPNRLFLARATWAWPNTHFHIFNQYVSELNGGSICHRSCVLRQARLAQELGGPTLSFQTSCTIKIYNTKQWFVSLIKFLGSYLAA